MKKLILILALVLSSTVLLSQNLHGSYAIAVTCKDGILIGEDSRMSLKINMGDPKVDTDKYNVQAYIDDHQKVFTLKDIAFCSVGTQFIAGKSIYNHMNSIDLPPLNAMNYRTYLQYIGNYFSSKYKNHLHELTKDFTLVIACYSNKTPVCCYLANGNSFGTKGRFAIETEPLVGFISHFSGKAYYDYTCKEMIPIIERYIKMAPVKTHRENVIGGKTMILQITPENKFIWIKNKPVKPPLESIGQLRDLYKKGKIEVHFTSGENKIMALKILSSN